MTVTSNDLFLAVIVITVVQRLLNRRSLFFHQARPRELALAFLLGLAYTIPHLLTIDFTIPEAEHRRMLEARLEPWPLLRLMIYVPLFEEYFNREIMLKNLTNRMGFPVALAISSLFFGLMHVLKGWPGFLFALLFGVLAGLLYRKYGYFAAAAAHSGANLGGTLFPYLVVLLR
ncbi:CPBP family intramembrane glutamic endopeptidase [Meiothermus ruber]|jgi:membrane protease YdiL (CAAX protease family)|uniref:Abortive infection protein n=1 Tax=Meiothermus ruber (strain ATCC 35948 / DSM 1279 / VKM B-1258 / 21) TaxID=504728 RepID=D3PQ86_MEIRD|nr:CPBP family intramembrane glutamic endopeptidase [Meiothermus ruber]ADD29719.1 Abortive infection protein [Meiothermus ruber DSM 1279]AGK04825.1 abortive infection protein [Meiothermus ruber DSM 1279]MCL6529580.1 CPBP family intramembrane metalloprotease [Meiothermus ruber]MCX7803308.1 CPBP family intramembrane metalloprotease [Meiothermus ruber]